MDDVTGWQNKDDDDLTAEDIDEMLRTGEPVLVSGSRLPLDCRLIGPAITFGVRGEVRSASEPESKLATSHQVAV